MAQAISSRGAEWARLLLGLLASATLPVLVGASPAPGRLDLEKRIAAQRAIEQVYWNHRIWPGENQVPKPALATVLSDWMIQAKVEDYLRKSNALEKWLHLPITAGQLQAEMDRMAADTHDPRTLRELFAALGDDPFVIAETLARQTLVERLIRNWHASARQFQGEVKTRAEGALSACRSVACMPSMGGEYRETTWRLEKPGPAVASLRAAVDTVRLDPDEWRDHLAELASKLGGTPERLLQRTPLRLEETSEAFVVTAVLSQNAEEVSAATVTWPKVSFDGWWATERGRLAPAVVESSSRFTLPAADSTGCVADTWSPLRSLLPEVRASHTAVWTGTEMIVWGGHNRGSSLNSGGRYDPSTDTWAPMSMTNAPPPRFHHAAVWTGTEMIVWGDDSSGSLNTGGRYDPTADAWAPMSTTNAPSARAGEATVWTGTEMIVWGGGDSVSGGYLNTGGRYDPSTDTWVMTSTANGPSPRGGHTAVWTGSELIVWGGYTVWPWDASTGGRYDPSTDTWAQVSTTAGPAAPRSGHSATWTGTQMIVWGGASASSPGGGYLNSGGRYDPFTDTWAAISTTNAPAPRAGHTAIRTDKELIVWGGYSDDAVGVKNSGGRYNPSTDTWTLTSTANAPSPRTGHTSVWTGTEMIVWGGFGTFSFLNSGGRYNPSTNTWTPTSMQTNVPAARAGHTAVWTGAEMIVWGGGTNTGGRYDPSIDAWTPTSTGGGVPAERSGHTAVWTGREMIVWGGWPMNTGGRYNPTTDTWTPTSTGENVPPGRGGHSAVWTGTEMIVWGGDNVGRLQSGARYDPNSDRWTPTSTEGEVPAGRSGHSAVWTGASMIVWGGDNGGPLDSGGVYSPSTDTWAPTSRATGLPDASRSPRGVWTGREMIIWGEGIHRGGRYDPSLDAWATVASSIFTVESFQSAVWTGSEMVLWGGIGFFCDMQGWAAWSATRQPSPEECYGYNVGYGGRYDPVADTWSVVVTDGPSARYLHTAVWTGTEMIVWGGIGSDGFLETGGRYCACPDGTRTYRDSDGDGYGDPGVSTSSCDGTIPAGHVRDGSDCDDTDALVRPGVVEICNGRDDNCEGRVDEGFDLGDPDGDGVETCRDVCPEIANPDQSPCACSPCAPFEIGIRFGADPAHGAALVTWNTDIEHDVRGFNIVALDNRGRRIQQNLDLIPCLECISDRGATYSFLIPKHRDGRHVFVEQIRLDGHAELFGPAVLGPRFP